MWVLLVILAVLAFLFHTFRAAGPSSKVLKEAPTNKDGPETKCEYPGKGVYASTLGDAEQKIVYAKKGPASAGTFKASTIGQLFKKCAVEKGDKIALKVESPLPQPEGKKVPPALPLEQWKTWTWKQYYDESALVAKSLIHLGVQQHQSVNIFGFNSPEWFMSQTGAILAGCKAAGIYPTDTPDQVRYKSAHSGGAVAIVESEKNLKTFLSIADSLPDLKAIVCWGCDVPEDTKVPCYTWDNFLKLGEKVPEVQLDERLAAQKPGHCCGLIYTSGTTGNPKAVMISHDNILFSSYCVLDIIKGVLGQGGPERILSYLPLSHVAGLMIDIISPIVGTAELGSDVWFEAYFARPYDLKLGSLGDRLRAVKPTLFLGVPRVWEKIAEKMKKIGSSTKGMKKLIAEWCKDKGLRHQYNCQLGGTGEKPPGHTLANKLVLSKIKEALGLDECKFGLTGAAPIQTETLEYFGALGIQINEVYGMSECTGATTWSTDDAHVWGSCGWAMPGTEVKVFRVSEDVSNKVECPRAKDMFHPSEPEQGEICFRGRHIMMGYLANASLGEEHVEETNKKLAEAIDEDGWLHSGDKGCISAEGLVRITGRFKELIIGAGGENIAPVPIEDAVKRACPGISNFMMVGDKRKFNVALVTLKAVGATGDGPGTNDLDGEAKEVDPTVGTITAAMKSKVWKDYIEAAIVAVNKDPDAVPNNASKIQRFTILPADFSVSTEELTPTLKTKRSVIEKKHVQMLDKIYDAGRNETYVEYDLSLLQ